MDTIDITHRRNYYEFSGFPVSFTSCSPAPAAGAQQRMADLAGTGCRVGWYVVPGAGGRSGGVGSRH